MARFRIAAGMAGCYLGMTAAASWAAAPTAQQVLQFQPRQPGVEISTPADAELAACKVELVNGPGGASGWLLRDGRGLPLRRFVASKGAKSSVDVWSYYLDGQEAYREIDSNANNKPDQFRWYGPNGSRWGVDVNEDGRIDGWKIISPEEVGQEVLKAIVARDPARFQALLLSEAELKALELPTGETARYRESLGQAHQKFQAAVAKLGHLTEKSRWLHLEAAAPQCVPAEALAGKYDLVRYKNATILYEDGGKHDWLTLGELVQVGRSWRLVAGPVAGHGGEIESTSASGGVALSAAAQPLINQLKAIDANAPKPGDGGAVLVKYNLDRAAVLEQIVAAVPEDQREAWVKQVADCYSAAAQSGEPGDRTAMQKLSLLRQRIGRDNPAVAAYVTYRELSAEYAGQLGGTTKGTDLVKIQEAWREKLKAFVQAYPTAEDAPDAVLQLGMVSEFIGKETEAKNWYETLAKNYAQHPFAAKGSGALRRLNLEGQELQLAGPVLGTGAPFDVAKFKGSVVIVYYWASWTNQIETDFVKLKQLQQKYGGKGVEIVSVNLDSSPQEALRYLQGNPAPGTHLHQAPGGLESPLAVNYGVMVLPNLFLVGRDGKVVSRSVQVGGLEDEVKKLLSEK